MIAIGCAHLIQRSQENREKLKASYTAESMIRRIESQLSRYLENSEFFKNIISSGYEISEDEFTDLSYLMKENKKVIEAYELGTCRCGYHGLSVGGQSKSAWNGYAVASGAKTGSYTCKRKRRIYHCRSV